MSLTLYKNALAGAPGFIPSQPFLLNGERATIDFFVTGASAGSTLAWYLEFSSDMVRWAREVSEDNAGGGAVSQPAVVRTFPAFTGDAAFSTQFIRAHQFLRVQFRFSAGGAALLEIATPFGMPANLPA